MQTARELEIASGHKSEFLATMSHELRTPLNAVIGFSDVLLERLFGELNERQEEYVRDIRDSGRHLLELINEILDLSKVEAGRMELEPVALSLPELLEQALALVRERAARQRLTVTLDVGRRSATVWARRDQAQAGRREPAHQRGQVHARGRVGRRRRAWLEGEEVVVYVRDTGVGIAAEDQARIFEAFQRGDRRVVRRGHRARADAVQALRRAARRADLGRERARRGQHVRLRDPGGCAA